MTSILISTVSLGICCRSTSMEGLKMKKTQVPLSSCGSFGSRKMDLEREKRTVAVRAEGEGINPGIRKTENKVVDSVVVTELSKPLTAYCRCWRSGTFPLCDGSHVKHNKATGDNVGPLLLKKQ